ncbi:hypothetical protein G6011_04896 [Alternaria panax]|uniref:Uncharacterized protein n=1 Tax=Alternaria panax TaxID=48097 RepID=A0AAD4IHC3_9PLEO|nr:hypothetical protein G6011_04896 [Alternaria panax]
MGEPTTIIVHLPADVYQDQFDFIEVVRDVTASIESQSPDEVIESQSSWASTAAVKFYRALFDHIDPTLELENVWDNSIMSADIAAKYMLKKMVKSLYLPFGDNYKTSSIFTYEVVSLLDTADEGMKSSRAIGILEALEEENYERTDEQKAYLKQMCTVLGRSGLLISPSELEQEVAASLDLFAATPDWEWSVIDRLLKSISKVMKMDATSSVQIATLDTIEAMIRSKYVFSHKNLQVLLFFTFSVALVLDGMADTRQSERLTALLNDLSVHRGVQTVQDRDSINGLCQNLGRMFDDVALQSTGDRFDDKELSKATSKLDIE